MYDPTVWVGAGHEDLKRVLIHKILSGNFQILVRVAISLQFQCDRLQYGHKIRPRENTTQ